jgi:threonylcarbamoyladenosine tRNA methylthiotransferase MtaB
MTFGADIIAGFPTETEAHFDASLRLVEECDLTWLHVFPYSPARHAGRADAAVDGPTIKDRARRLRDAGETAVTRHLSAQVGQTHAVLMENPRMGRTAQFAEVIFDTDQPEGRIVEAHDHGSAGRTAAGAARLSTTISAAP